VAGTDDFTPSIEKDTNWKKFLASLTVDDILKEKTAAGITQLIVVDSCNTVQEVLHTLGMFPCLEYSKH
jgi:hypothetical protein